MATIFVARSPTLSQWASDVGHSKHVFKVGVTDEPVKALVERGWADLADWTLIKKQEAGALAEEAAFDRLASKAKLVDPSLYPRLRGTPGVFKVLPAHVESRRMIAHALDRAGDTQDPAAFGETSFKAPEGRARVTDFASYLLHHATSSSER